LSGLVGALLVLVAFAYGVVGNLAANALPRPRPITLVGLLLGLTLLMIWATGWKERLDRRVDTADAVPGIDPRNRPRLLKQVQERAKQQVKQALHHAIVLELGLETRSDLIEFPDDLLIRRIDDLTAHPIPANQSKLTTFAQLDQAMLLLGEPGAGKTVWLNQLAVELAECATADPGQPIPVVLNLASWASRRGCLDGWLVEQLAVAYQVHPTLGATLVQSDGLLPLLDGLDEVSEPDRAGCVTAINTFQEARAHPDRRLRPLVVCSRRVEAEALAARLARLRLAGAVTLQPPSSEKVAEFLAAVGASEVLAMLPARPEDDPELWALLRSPLTLSIIALAGSRAAATLRQPAGQRLDALLDAYVGMLLTPPGNGGRLRPALAVWPPAQTCAWLAWLAASMTRHAQVEFYLERLQPTWLPTRRARRAVKWAPTLGGGLVGGLVGGLLGVVLGLVSGIVLGGLIPGTLEATTRPNQGIHRSTRYGLLGGVLTGGLLVGLTGVLGIGLVGVLASGLTSALLVGSRLGGVAAIQHYTLRLLLVQLHATPWRYVRFLNAACDNLLLRHVDGGYRFPHRLVQERLTAYPPTAPVAPDPRQPSH
jgi:hypothetical protein